MGVTGLWKLVEPCGNPVPIETLEGKILAVDISIWLHQIVKGYQDSKGCSLPHAHLLGLFHRLCKLYYYRVRPVFVFDGCVPEIKRNTIIRRQHQRSKLNSEADRMQTLLLQSLAKEKVVQQALGINTDLLLKSSSKRQSFSSNEKSDMKDDIFKLPVLGENETSLLESSKSTVENSFDDSNPWREYSANLQAIDVRSDHFKSLPPEVRHEILIDIKETRKQSSWGRLNDLPSRSDDFSSFQMKRLLKRRAVQETIEETEKEMGGKALTYTDLQIMFTEEGILDSDHGNKPVLPICSDEAVRFTLVRDLKNIKKNLTKTHERYVLNKTKHSNEIPENQTEKTNQIYATDLETAISLSVLDDIENVYNELDYEYESNEDFKLNRQQRNQLRNTAVGPARSYMIEHGGMNCDEVEKILHQTQDEVCTEILELNMTKSGSDDMSREENLERSKYLEKDTKNDTSAEVFEGVRLRVRNDSEKDLDLEKEADKNQLPPKDKPIHNLEVTKDPVDSEFDIFSDILISSKAGYALIGSKNSFGKSVQNDKAILLHRKCLEEANKADAAEVGQGIRLKNCDDSDTDSDLEEVYTLSPKNAVESEDAMFPDIFKPSKEETAFVDAQKFVKMLPENDDVLLHSGNNVSLGKCSIVKQAEKGDNIKKNYTTNQAPNAGAVEENKNISSILYDLKKQARNIESINLDTINIASWNSSCETIEIYDSDDQKVSQVITTPKSPNLLKINSINNYFETKYVIKRTPEKNEIEGEDKHSHGAKSPFFVKRSLLSQRFGSTDKTHQSSIYGQKLSKASKTLFGGSNKAQEDNIHRPSKDLFDLKQQKTNEELQKMAADLEKERLDLENGRNRQDRMATTINQNMQTECQNLLQLFGIPYIIAPMEAEAQCAFLESIHLTDGTITDDSDIWLFGGRTVYKNFFEQNKHVLKFEADKIKQSFNCDREKFIQLACLVGSDYTTGIHGIGTVTALEILAAFSTTPEVVKKSNNHYITTATVIEPLCRFQRWLKAYKDTAQPVDSSTRLNLQKKLKNIELYEGFPNPAVVEAYLNPKVDKNEDSFIWGYPEVDSIHAFSKKVFGWTKIKTDELLKPILKRISDRQTQTSIHNYFTTESAIKPRELKVSKRVQKAIDAMASKSEETKDVHAKKKKVKQSHMKTQKNLSIKRTNI